MSKAIPRPSGRSIGGRLSLNNNMLMTETIAEFLHDPHFARGQGLQR